MPSPESNISIETLVQQRRSAERFLRRLLPTREIDLYHSKEQAHERVQSGEGLLVISNHFSLRDGPQAFLSVPAKDDVMMTKVWTAPIADHQYPIASFFNRILKTHINLYPIVTPDTKEKFPDRRLGKGLPEYVDAARETLIHGDILIVFPQAKRNDHLGQPDDTSTTMSLLIHKLTKKGVTNFSVLPIGFGLPEGTDYAKASGPHLCRVYDVAIGKLWSYQEMIASASQIGSFDIWAYNQLRPLVPSSYR